MLIGQHRINAAVGNTRRESRPQFQVIYFFEPPLIGQRTVYYRTDAYADRASQAVTLIVSIVTQADSGQRRKTEIIKPVDLIADSFLCAVPRHVDTVGMQQAHVDERTSSAVAMVEKAHSNNIPAATPFRQLFPFIISLYDA